MDLHFTSATATGEERAAVDGVLTTQRPDVERNDQGEPAVPELVRGRAGERHLLLPVLHAVQSRVGWISPGALNYLCERLQIPPAEAYGVATFYALFSVREQPATVVHVCDDIACKTRGADVICTGLEQRFGPAGVADATGKAMWKRSPCLGLCEQAPAAFCQRAGTDFCDASIGTVDAGQLLSVLAGGPISPRPIGLSTPHSDRSVLWLLSRAGTGLRPELDIYLAGGGYAGFARAIELGATAAIGEVRLAGLTGRGGAAFPAAAKWTAVASNPAQPHYLVCNADESEPGTFKDRVLLEEDPFAVVEAMTIAGFACGAEYGYLYIRGEYHEASESMRAAIHAARSHGYLGSNILGAGVRFDIEIRRGAGAYICGEETALLESIEGKRGEPRNKPPFPAQVGLFGKPTAVNNVETLVNLLPIMRLGGAAYAAGGSSGSTGTRLFCLSGCIARPGVYEVPYGCTLRALLEMAGGVRNGRPLVAVLLGGAAGVFLRPDELDLPLTLDGARQANATLGSGVVMVFDDTVDMGAILLRIAAFFRDESCGQCVPCRVGTVRQEEALQRLISGSGSADHETDILTQLDAVMTDASICGLGQTASSAIRSVIHRLGMFAGKPE